MASNISQQLLQVHKAVQVWESCKSDLAAATRALTDAARLLCTCLNMGLLASSVSALHPGTFYEPTSTSGSHADEPAPGQGPYFDANPCSSTSFPLADLNYGSCERQQGPQLPATAGAPVKHHGSVAQTPDTHELLALTCQELAQAQYLHALTLCASGQGSAADPWIAGLGYRLRLSDLVWAACAVSVRDDFTVDAVSGAATRAEVAVAATKTFGAAAQRRRGGRTGSSVSITVECPSPGDSCSANDLPAPISPNTMSDPPNHLEYDSRGTSVGLVSEIQDTGLRSLPPLICDGVLPTALVHRLAVAFDPSGTTPYWRQHCYGKRETPFFSYLYRLDQPPLSVVEEAIQLLHRILLKTATVRQPEGKGEGEEGCAVGPANAAPPVCGTSEIPGASEMGTTPSDATAAAAIASAFRGVVAAEWWAHTRDPAAAHQLHFDVNEDVLRQGLESYHLAHPVLSSVLFLPPAARATPGCYGPAEPVVNAAAGGADATFLAALSNAAHLRTCTRPEEWGVCPGGPTLVLDQTPEGARAYVGTPDLRRDLGPPPSLSSAPTHSPLAASAIAAASAAAAAERPALALRAWPVGPRPNRLLLFPGNLLHGVMPQPTPEGFAAPFHVSEPSQLSNSGLVEKTELRHGGQSMATTAAALPRTTLIVAWWGPERLQTAVEAPSMILMGGKGGVGPHAVPSSVRRRGYGSGTGDGDGDGHKHCGLGATAAIGEGGSGSGSDSRGVRGGSAKGVGRKKRSREALLLLEAFLKKVVKRDGDGGGAQEGNGEEEKETRGRSMGWEPQSDWAKGPGAGARRSGRGSSAGSPDGEDAILTLLKASCSDKMQQNGSVSGGSNSRSSGRNSSSSGDSKYRSHSSSSSSSSGKSGDDGSDGEDDNAGSASHGVEEEEEEEEEEELGGCEEGFTTSRYRRCPRLDWRHSGPLRPGMLIPKQVASDNCTAFEGISLKAPVEIFGGERSSRIHLPSTGSETTCTETNGNWSSSGLRCADGSSPRTRLPPTWRHFFAALQDKRSLASSGEFSNASREGGATSPLLQWQVPACASPAWVLVQEPLRCPIRPNMSGSIATAGAPMQEKRASVAACGSAEKEECQEDAGLGDSLPPPPPCSVWQLARQAVRGMAIALGLPPALLVKELQQRGQRQLLGSQSQVDEEEEEQGHGHDNGQQPDGALRYVMEALELPELRVFLCDMRDLERLYLPPKS